ncbi:Lrp/AsnC family transcriptional regulator [Halorubrum sp. ARQ200]|jgi:DNA-binding Lrp family transcriptional regulator|uniref:Lrp/AsnC family transcriptional regulator n=1 Tax=Halorubrum sp. ARQ200 TaxID=1855872 RepID=UPI0010F58295|nr:Lrp/AsnC family transcriptional regulator [Halorubrum sp. ARQ200]TKX42823.1 winged helix-turn-helix domain-containing protein [Halorubrum sp. ARQ200]
MPEKQPRPNWNLSERDTIILQELARDPQLTSRKLRDLLEAEHDIDVSHVTVSESIRRMREDGVFREALVPNEEQLFFSLFEFQFNPEGFDDNWRDALEHIQSSRHTFMYFLSDGDYQWKTIMMFKDREQESKWIHNFYKEYGELIANLRNSVVTNVLKFGTDPELFEVFQEDDDGA